MRDTDAGPRQLQSMSLKVPQPTLVRGEGALPT